MRADQEPALPRMLPPGILALAAFVGLADRLLALGLDLVGLGEHGLDEARHRRAVVVGLRRRQAPAQVGERAAGVLQQERDQDAGIRRSS